MDFEEVQIDKIEDNIFKLCFLVKDEIGTGPLKVPT